MFYKFTSTNWLKLKRKKEMKKIILLITTMLFSSAVFADYCANWGCISTIKDLYTNAEGVVYIGTPLDEKIANCTPLANVYFTLDPNASNFQEIYSTLLAAYLAKEKVQLRVHEGTSNCNLAYVRLSTDF